MTPRFVKTGSGRFRDTVTGEVFVSVRVQRGALLRLGVGSELRPERFDLRDLLPQDGVATLNACWVEPDERYVPPPVLAPQYPKALWQAREAARAALGSVDLRIGDAIAATFEVIDLMDAFYFCGQCDARLMPAWKAIQVATAQLEAGPSDSDAARGLAAALDMAAKAWAENAVASTRAITPPQLVRKVDCAAFHAFQFWPPDQVLRWLSPELVIVATIERPDEPEPTTAEPAPVAAERRAAG